MWHKIQVAIRLTHNKHCVWSYIFHKIVMAPFSVLLRFFICFNKIARDTFFCYARLCRWIIILQTLQSIQTLFWKKLVRYFIVTLLPMWAHTSPSSAFIIFFLVGSFCYEYLSEWIWRAVAWTTLKYLCTNVFFLQKCPLSS